MSIFLNQSNLNQQECRDLLHTTYPDLIYRFLISKKIDTRPDGMDAVRWIGDLTP
ncbi:hypothetical protein D3C80_499860 [compost metagenome]